MHKALHPRGIIQRLYVSSKGIRELACIEACDCVDTSTAELEDYIKKIKESLIRAASDNVVGNIKPDRKTMLTSEQKLEEIQA